MENQIDKISSLIWQDGPPTESGEWLLEIQMFDDIIVTYLSVQCVERGEDKKRNERNWYKGFIYDPKDGEVPYINLTIFGPGIGTDLYRAEYENRFGQFKIMRSAYLGPNKLITIDESIEMIRKCKIINAFVDKNIEKGNYFYRGDYWYDFLSSLRKNYKEGTNISIIDITELNKLFNEYFGPDCSYHYEVTEPLIVELHNIPNFKRTTNDSVKEMLQEIFEFSYIRASMRFRPGVYAFVNIEKQ